MTGPLDSLLRPRSIAIIGASDNHEALGGRVTAHVFGAGFRGPIYPVNPRKESIHGVPAYARVADLPAAPDTVVVLVRRDLARAAVEECCAKGAKSVVVVTAGFGEIDAAGKAAQAELTAICRAHGARLLGPNCMGVINTDPEVALDSTFSPTQALRGPIGFVSQSGALGVAVLNLCHERGIGFSQFVSLGNKADVTENDVLAAWEHDDAVPVVAMYLESFADPRRFFEVAQRVAAKKPVVLVKAGRTEEGARAASSHTGALASGDSGADALCRQAGIIRADSISEMLDTALLLSRCPLPKGRRVAILTNAGGPAILCSDAVAQAGLELLPLSRATQSRLRDVLVPEAATGNPVDMVASAGPNQYADCLDTLLRDPEVDAVVTITVTPPIGDPVDYMEAMKPLRAQAPKPWLAVFMAGHEFYGRVRDHHDLPPIYRLPEEAVRALAAACRYHASRETLELPSRRMTSTELPDLVAEIVAGAPAGYLGPNDTFRLLKAIGLPVVPWRVAADADEAAAAARSLGFPVVVKAMGDALVHKSDVGAVALDLRSEHDVRAAIERISHAIVGLGHDQGSWAWLVQSFHAGGREVIVGASRDPAFGPLVMFGLGGKYVEVFKDVAFGIAPLTPHDARRMVASIRGLPLLTGVRGEEAVDLNPAVRTIERVAQLCQLVPRIEELDLNPLLLYPDREDAAIVDARIRLA